MPNAILNQRDCKQSLRFTTLGIARTKVSGANYFYVQSTYIVAKQINMALWNKNRKTQECVNDKYGSFRKRAFDKEKL